MNDGFVARLMFKLELRDMWPTSEIVAEAHLGTEIFSLWLRLWSAPDDTGGACMADGSFLVPNISAPVNTPIRLTLGRTTIATCIIEK